MAESFDPRFDPRFQPGYSPSSKSASRADRRTAENETVPEKPGEQGKPKESGVPDEPGKPKKSGVPVEPETPKKSDVPDEPETSKKSDIPDEADESKESDEPGEPDSGSPDEHDPFERTLWVVAIALVVGGVVAAYWANGINYAQSAIGTPWTWQSIVQSSGWALSSPMITIGLALAVGLLFRRAMTWRPPK
ncbi:MAG: hypothetical protein KF801_04115 [Cryobacterium sp.]|nr:hypothetical protein [Cryobacterium sp.]